MSDQKEDYWARFWSEYDFDANSVDEQSQVFRTRDRVPIEKDAWEHTVKLVANHMQFLKALLKRFVNYLCISHRLQFLSSQRDFSGQATCLQEFIVLVPKMTNYLLLQREFSRTQKLYLRMI